jgi:hypothetical protein
MMTNGWYLGGSGNADAWATCVDRTPNTGLGEWEVYGSLTLNLVQADINSTQCFLYGVGGASTTPTTPAKGSGSTTPARTSSGPRRSPTTN